MVNYYMANKVHVGIGMATDHGVQILFGRRLVDCYL